MNADQVLARSAIEALRSGVPSRHAVEQLGTTQNHVKEAFEARLDAMAAGDGVDPLVISANFGGGKSHLLNYLRSVAANHNCVSSLVIVSPEMPLGNPHVVLKAIGEAAQAPGRNGRALRELASTLNTSSRDYANLRLWARDAGIDERFVAMLHLYEELRVDEEFRTQILGDFEGGPIMVTLLRQKLKDLGQAAGYALKGTKNALLAHDRIRILARLYQTCGCDGWVILFDEVERFSLFPTKQRLAAWEEMGWWQEAAKCSGARILPVFAMLSGALEQVISKDQPRFQSIGLGLDPMARDRLGLAGVELLKHPDRLTAPDADQEEQIEYRIKMIYELAYGAQVAPIALKRSDVHTTIRSEIRRWITLWDLRRIYPDYNSHLISEDVTFDTSAITDEAVLDADDDSGSIA